MTGGPIGIVHAAIVAAGGVPCVIVPRLGPVQTSDDRPPVAAGTFENSAPVLFDAVVLPDGEAGVERLARGEALPETAARFVAAVGLHRHPARERDPPLL